ncbi:hypothetical protein [Pedobacter sp. KBW01]|uniref:hypothetical protein n=1 Tax=Pedobacter sp. KBW01 TaxID=2153364 RepID=UPI001F2AE846|nr:hypothetical protein [Pedobacter sp. KBW01]
MMISPTKRRRAVDSRRMAYQIMFLYNRKLSRKEAAAVFNRDHSTVTCSVYSHADLMKSDPKYKETYLMLEKKVTLQLGEPKTGSNAP